MVAVSRLEVCGLLTPLHIVPEWYFLCQYAMLKAVPNKNAGFIILLTSIFTFFFFGEIRNLTTFTRLMDYNNGFSLSCVTQTTHHITHASAPVLASFPSFINVTKPLLGLTHKHETRTQHMTVITKK